MSRRGWRIGITPYAAGQFTTFDLPAYAEQAIAGANTFALTYGAKSVTDTRSELGLRTDKSFAMQNGIFTLRGRAAWAHDFNTDRNIGATFQTLPGASFVVNGAAQAQRRRARHRLRRDEMAERLLARRHLRGRVLQRHQQLRRQGRGAVCVVIFVGGGFLRGGGGGGGGGDFPPGVLGEAGGGGVWISLLQSQGDHPNANTG